MRNGRAQTKVSGSIHLVETKKYDLPLGKSPAFHSQFYNRSVPNGFSSVTGVFRGVSGVFQKIKGDPRAVPRGFRSDPNVLKQIQERFRDFYGLPLGSLGFQQAFHGASWVPEQFQGVSEGFMSVPGGSRRVPRAFQWCSMGFQEV